MRRALAGTSARGQRFMVLPVAEEAKGVSIPAPVEGWDTLSPVAEMKPKRALTLKNMFPQPGYVEIRKGHKRHALLGSIVIDSLMPYHGLTSSTDRLFAATSSVISNVTVLATATASVALSGLANARWQHVNFSNTAGNWLWACNGADTPRMYDGSTWATASVIGITPTDIINVTVFKERLWLVRKDLMNPAYLGLDAVQGTATPFDLSGVFDKGGFLQAIGTWSTAGGDAPDDRIVFVTSRGEVAVYAGTDPASNFAIVTRFDMGASIGRRCLTKVGSDLAIVCMDGVLPVSRAIVTDRAAAMTQSITRNIQPDMNQAARQYGTHFGWQLTAYPRGTRAILNVPVQEGVEQEQYVMNTVSGAWGRFTMENANCWAVFQDRPFYGGNDGRVYEADCQGFDEGSAIPFDLETAFNYCGSRGRLKEFTMCRPLLTSDGTITPTLAVNVDYGRLSPGNSVTFEQSSAAQWDVAEWDVAVWPEESDIIANWVSVAGIGYCVSIRMSGNVQAAAGEEGRDFTLRLNGFDLLGLRGGHI